MDRIAQRMAELEPPDADVADVAAAVVRVVGMPKGKRPFRVEIDPTDDGSHAVNEVADHIRAEFIRRLNLGDLLHPTNT